MLIENYHESFSIPMLAYSIAEGTEKHDTLEGKFGAQDRALMEETKRSCRSDMTGN